MSRMPVLFVGHGSPMNALEDNSFSRGWRAIAARLPRPAGILAISAHWTSTGSRVNNDPNPRTVYDFYGFPRELYDLAYQAPGSPELARETARLIGPVAIDNSWGIDHGTWSVLRWMFPAADIPVAQLSIDDTASRRSHLEAGRLLRPLREQGILILGSGNVVHNLARIDWDLAGGFDWADEFDHYIRDSILDRRFEDVIEYRRAGQAADRAFRTLEHFDPLLYTLGAADGNDRLTVFNDARTLGSLSMTSYLFE
jgi:4,5-DOPA dioxygenase extradiol